MERPVRPQQTPWGRTARKWSAGILPADAANGLNFRAWCVTTAPVILSEAAGWV